MISLISCIGLCQENESPGPVNKMEISLVAIGSRGDVQPYIALGLGLQRAGYQVQSENGVGKAVGYIQEFLETSHLKSTNLL
jgi:hypothetical protein